MDLKIILPFSLFTIFSLAFVAAFLVVRVRKGASPLALILKICASLGFVFGGIYAFYITGAALANLFIVLGLILALIGDIVLDLKCAYKDHEKFYLNTGMGAFSLSSVAYFVALVLIFYPLENFAIFVCGSALMAAIFAVVVQLSSSKMKLNLKGYRAQVAVYSFLISLIAFFSLGIAFIIEGTFIFAVGAFLVLISDLILSFTYFGSPKYPEVYVIINHILYYIGELLIMAYIFFQIV